mmetsp:Transcript_19650/g.36363  ORF Transcript_19650/g.36363 Transcript_19650/m.36363 type:complete len:1062 (-) Transcript_19650:4941-8126(-)
MASTTSSWRSREGPRPSREDGNLAFGEALTSQRAPRADAGGVSGTLEDGGFGRPFQGPNTPDRCRSSSKLMHQRSPARSPSLEATKGSSPLRAMASSGKNFRPRDGQPLPVTRQPPRKFTFSSSLRAGAGNAALQAERAQWNDWIKRTGAGTLGPAELGQSVSAARLTFPSSVISRRDCGQLVNLAVIAANKVIVDMNHDADTFISAVAGVAELVTLFSQKKHLDFGAVELSDVVDFLIKAIQSGVDAALLAGLRSLSFVLFDNAGRCGSFQDDLLAALLAVVKNEQPPSDLEVVSLAFSCIGNLLQRKALDSSVADSLALVAQSAFNKYLILVIADSKSETLLENGRAEERLKHTKVLQSVCRVLHGIALAFGKGILSKQVPTLAHGLVELICNGVALATAERDFKQRVELTDSQSESETGGSDVERRATSTRYLKQLEKVRVTALELLQNLCRIEYKAMQTQWDRVLPQRNGTGIHPGKYNLLTVILYDPQPRVRAAACGVVAALVEHSPIRVWLSQRRPSAKQRVAFDSLGVKVARIMEQLHHGLAAGVAKEKNPSVLVQMLTCIGALFRAVPYELESNKGMLAALLSSYPVTFVSILFQPSTQKVGNVQETAVSCVASLLYSSKCPLDPVAKLLQDAILPELFPSDQNTEAIEPKKRWPIGLNFTLLITAKIFLWYTEVIEAQNLWSSQVHGAVLAGFASHDSACREAALTLVQQVSKTDQNESIVKRLDGWGNIVGKHVARALKDIDASVREVAATAVSDIRPETWAFVTEENLKECLSVMIEVALMPSSKGSIQLGTLSALASLALLQSMKYKRHFLQAVIPVLTSAMSDEDHFVRARAATAIGNLASPYGPDGVEADEVVVLEASFVEWDRLLLVALDHANDTEKVAAPSLRSIGFLVCCLKPGVDVDLLERARCALLAHICPTAPAKLSLSACTAVQHLITHSSLLSLSQDQELLRALIQTGSRATSFKVRVLAISALISSQVIFGAFAKETVVTFVDMWLHIKSTSYSLAPNQAKFVAKLEAVVEELVAPVARNPSDFEPEISSKVFELQRQ